MTDFDIFVAALASLQRDERIGVMGDEFPIIPPTEDYGYDATPKSAVVFGAMGVDGVHYAILKRDGEIQDDSPVVHFHRWISARRTRYWPIHSLITYPLRAVSRRPRCDVCWIVNVPRARDPFPFCGNILISHALILMPPDHRSRYTQICFNERSPQCVIQRLL